MPKRDHANHNKSICNYLDLNTDKIACFDWIITTAFYSVIHYIDHAVFPCDYKGNMVKNISDLQNLTNARNPHAARSLLVNEKLPKLKGDYEFLSSNCHNAWYHNYIVNPAIADLAKRKLEHFALHFDKEKRLIDIGKHG